MGYNIYYYVNIKLRQSSGKETRRTIKVVARDYNGAMSQAIKAVIKADEGQVVGIWINRKGIAVDKRLRRREAKLAARNHKKNYVPVYNGTQLIRYENVITGDTKSTLD